MRRVGACILWCLANFGPLYSQLDPEVSSIWERTIHVKLELRFVEVGDRILPKPRINPMLIPGRTMQLVLYLTNQTNAPVTIFDPHEREAAQLVAPGAYLSGVPYICRILDTGRVDCNEELIDVIPPADPDPKKVKRVTLAPHATIAVNTFAGRLLHSAMPTRAGRYVMFFFGAELRFQVQEPKIVSCIAGGEHGPSSMGSHGLPVGLELAVCAVRIQGQPGILWQESERRDNTTSAWVHFDRCEYISPCPIGFVQLPGDNDPLLRSIRYAPKTGMVIAYQIPGSQAKQVRLAPGLLRVAKPGEERIARPGPVKGATLVNWMPSTYAVSRPVHSNWGHPVEYQLAWDGARASGWSSHRGKLNVQEERYSRLWLSSGVRYLRVRARCKLHPWVLSEESEPLVVTFADNAQRCFLTTFVDPIGAGTINHADAFRCGSEVPITVVERRGFEFAGYSGALTGRRMEQTLRLTESQTTVTAHFTPSPPVELTITPKNVVVRPGQPQNVQVRIQHTADPRFEWEWATDGAVSVGNDGSVEGNFTDTIQTVRRIVFSKADPTKREMVTITVVPRPKISFSPAWATLHSGESQEFNAKVEYADDPTVIFRMSDVHAGSLQTTGPNTAVYTAPANPSIGDSTVIFARSQQFPKLQETVRVRLDPSIRASIEVMPVSATIRPGEIMQFHASLETKAPDHRVRWSVFPPGIVEIDDQGKVTAPISLAGPERVVVIATPEVNHFISAKATLWIEPWPKVAPPPLLTERKRR